MEIAMFVLFVVGIVFVRMGMSARGRDELLTIGTITAGVSGLWLGVTMLAAVPIYPTPARSQLALVIGLGLLVLGIAVAYFGPRVHSLLIGGGVALCGLVTIAWSILGMFAMQY